MYALTQTVAPATDPISLALAKQHLHVTSEYEDTYIASLIKAAVDWGQAFTGRQFSQATWQLSVDRFPRGCTPFYVPLAPLSSVTSVKYIDTDGAEQTVATSVYDVLTGREPGEIVKAYGQSWPTPRAEEGAVRILFVAGYSSVPEGIIHGLLLRLKTMFDNRADVVHGALSQTDGAENLLNAFVVGDEFHQFAVERTCTSC